MIKVLHVINNLNIGGAENLLLESLPLYKEQEVVVDLLLLNSTDSFFLKKIKKYKNIKIYNLNSCIYNPIIVLKLIPYFKKYDMVHVNLFPSIYWVSIAKFISRSKLKLILTEHAAYNRRMFFFFRFIDKVIYSNYDKIITISRDVDSAIKKHIKLPEDRFQLIFNGVNTSSIFKAKPSKDKEIIRFLGSRCKLLIQVSRFQKQKDQKTLIKAIALLPDNIKLLLVGEGELKKECELLVNQLRISNRVKFLGIRTDVPQLLKLSDIVILSTNYEGLSLSSIEGLASGRPFIGSNVPGLTEVVENAGVLFPQGDDKALASHINNILNDQEYYNIIAKACAKRSGFYEISYMVRKYSILYRKLL